MSASISDLARFFDASPNPYLVLDRDLNIAAANAAYLASVDRELSDIVGRWAWDAFPTDEETLKQTIDSFELVKRTRKPDTMPLLRFDIPTAGGSEDRFEKRYWSITHTPVLDAAGEVEFILQHPIDVTALERLRQTVDASGGDVDLRREHSGIFDRAETVYRANQKLTNEAERSAAAIASLSAERETLAGLFEQAPSFMALLLGREHRVEFANPGYLALIGGRPIIGRTIAEALGDAVAQGYLDLLDQVFDSGVAHQASGARYAVQPVSGGPVDERVVDFVLQPFRDRDDHVIGICVQGVDVTARVREDRFRTTLERLTTLVTRLDDPVDLAFEASALVGEVLGASRVGYSRIEHEDGMLVTDHDWTAPGVVSLTGRLQLRQFGTFIEDLKQGEIVAIDDVRLDPRTHDAAAGLEERHARAFLDIPVTERSKLVAVFFVNMADVHAWSDAESAFIREAAERVRTATERLSSDLARQRATDQVRALNATLEQRVAALAAERDQLWRLSRDPFVVCDLDGRWISASPVWTEILGWRLDELTGRTSSWMEHPEDVSRTQQKVVDVAGGEVMLAFVNRFRGKDGRYRTFSWTAVSEGERLFCVARDITLEMIRDEALRRYESIVQSDTAPICAFDTGYRQIAFNRAHSDDFFRT